MSGTIDSITIEGMSLCLSGESTRAIFMMNFWDKKSRSPRAIWKTLALGTTGALLGFVLIPVETLRYFGAQRAVTQQETEREQYLSMAVSASRAPLENVEIENLKALASEWARCDPFLRSVRILDRSGKTLTRWSSEKVLSDESKLALDKDIANEQTPLGRIEMSWDREALHAEFWSDQLLSRITLIAGLLIGGCFLVLWVRRSLASPIGKIRESLQMLSRRRADQPCPHLSFPSREFDDMAHALNGLVDALEARQERETKLEQAEAVTRYERDRALELIETETAFLASMAHELRTPLHGILSFAQFGLTASANGSRTKLRSLFETIEANGRDLLGRICDLFEIVELESGKMELKLESINIRDLVVSTIEEILPSANPKDLTVHTCMSDEFPKVVIDQKRIAQVIRKLLDNAVRYSPHGGRIEIDLHKMGNRVRLTIRDNGVGIPKDEFEKIFEKFEQSTRTKTGEGGTGLGLSICRLIVELHGGRIWAESFPGEGAIFAFALPTIFEEVLVESNGDDFASLGSISPS